MTIVELVIVVAVLIGFTIGRWYEHDRAGGTGQMRRQRDNARRACDRARQERDTAIADARRPAALRRYRGVAADATINPAPLHLVRGEQR